MQEKRVELFEEELEELLHSNRGEDLYLKSFHDNLTGLYNHTALNEYLARYKNVCLLLLNVDHFSNINNAYGFKVGDFVLKQIGELLHVVQPSFAKLFRLHSDEFVFVVDSSLPKAKIIEMIDSIQYFFSESDVELEENISIKISFSIGVCCTKSDDMLHNAKIAILELREHQRASYNFFDPNSDFLQKQKSNIYWFHRIKNSISEGNLFPYFQPIRNNKTKKIEKYECLARIDDKDSLIPPIRFMEAAKLTGMLSSITKTIIQQSFKIFSQNSYQLSINITSEDLYMGYLEDFLEHHSKKHSIEPNRIILEILEDITSYNDEETIKQLYALRAKGYKIAIDDFGSQSSNFSRLLDFNPDYLKIDGSFIKNLQYDEKSRVICEAIVFLSHNSNIEVVAEYVHSAKVQELVEQMGIDYSQGYFVGKPQALV